ncbi:MAG: glycosyltransferase family 1 protein [Candidatus Pacearchaeota archaeon]
MNIFIDVRLCSYNYQGVKTYIENILPYLLSKKEYVFYLAGHEDFINKYKNYDNVKTIKFAAPINSIKEQILGFNIMRKYKKEIDVFFFPYPSVPISFFNTNFVVKLYDVTPFKFWYYFNPIKVLLGILVMKIIILKAKKIIVVSESTRKDLVQYFGMNSIKAVRIYGGVNEHFKKLDKEEVEKFMISKNLTKYVLFVGNREKSKNIFRLIQAIRLLKDKGFDIQLLIIGRKFKAYEKIDKEILSFEEFVKIVYDVPNEDLVRYYNAAEIYVQPSLNEGFGLPVLEAMRCGCACAVSDIPVFREIFADTCLYFNPYSVEDIANTLKKILTDEELKEKLRQKSIKHAEKFSWEITAKGVLNIFEQLKRS